MLKIAVIDKFVFFSALLPHKMSNERQIIIRGQKDNSIFRYYVETPSRYILLDQQRYRLSFYQIIYKNFIPTVAFFYLRFIPLSLHKCLGPNA